MFAARGTGLLLFAMCSIRICPAAAQPAPGFADAVLGYWDLTVMDEDESWPSWLEVRLRTETQLMGSFVGRFGSARHLPEIDYTDGELHFSAPQQYEAGDQALVFTGTLTSGRLEGSSTDSQGRRLRWSGVRAPALDGNDGNREYRAATPVALFNGRDLSGWHARFGDATRCWSVQDATLISTPPCVDLVSDGLFDDFSLDVEFSYPPGSNSGIYLQGRYEVQIQDTAGQALDALRMGALYGFIAPSLDAAGMPGEWQTMRITLAGRRLSVSLNGQEIISAQRVPGITGGALDSREGEAGPIMLQGDHGEIRFRKIELRPLLRVD